MNDEVVGEDQDLAIGIVDRSVFMRFINEHGQVVEFEFTRDAARRVGFVLLEHAAKLDESEELS